MNSLEDMRTLLQHDCRPTTSKAKEVLAEVDAELARLRADNAALEAKLKTAADAHPGCGLLDDLAGECQCARREQHLRADNARLREAWKNTPCNCKHCDHMRDCEGCTNDVPPCARDTALAATDSREWQREFGIRVAYAIEGMPVTRERRDQIAAIVAGVMK